VLTDAEVNLEELEQEEEEDKRILEELKRRADERRRRQEEYHKKKLAEHSRREEREREEEDKRRRHEEEEEERRQEEEAERTRKREDDKRREREDSQRRKEKEKRRKEEEQRRSQEEARKKEEEQRKTEEEKARKDREKKERPQRKSHSRRREDRRRSTSPTQAEPAKVGGEVDTQVPEEAAAVAACGSGRGEPAHTDEQARAARQQRAIMAVLACFHKLSDVTLENFQEVKAEFEHVMTTELPETGAQQDILKTEANRVFGYAQQYVEQIKEQQRSWEELKQKKEKEERSRREEERRRQEEERLRLEEERRKQEEERKIKEEEKKRKEEEEREREREKTRKDEEDRRREEEQRKRDERTVDTQLTKEELRRRKEEERRRHEEELQRRREERRKRERSELEKEEEKRRAEREVRRKEEEEKRREQRERNAELEKKKAEEEQAKREEEAKVRREQQATLAVLRGLQKLSDANPENFETLRAEFEQVMKTELPDTGAQQEMLKAEAERVFGYAQQYVEQVKAQQRQADELEAQRRAKAKEQERQAMELLEELQRRVTQAEAAAEKAQATSAPLTAVERQPAAEDREALRAARAVEHAGRAALASCAACTDFMEQKRSTILEAEALREESAKLLQMAQPRIAAAARLTQEALRHSKAQKERVARILAPTIFSKKTTDLFKKHDRDSDGFLCRTEVLQYSKQEFNFSMPEENLERIFHQLVAPGAKGVELARFQQLKTAIGIARHEDRGRLKKLSPEERKKREEEDARSRDALVSERREALAKLGEALLASTKDLDGRVQAVERAADELSAAGAHLRPKELMAKIVAVDAMLKATKIELGDVQHRVKSLRHDLLAVKELLEQMRPELTMLSNCANMYSSRLRKVASMVASSRQTALGKAFEKYENLRLEVAGKLRACIEALGGKAVDLFQVISKKGGDTVTTEEVRFFLAENQCALEPEKLDRIFAACGQGSILEDDEDKPEAGNEDGKVAGDSQDGKADKENRGIKDDVESRETCKRMERYKANQSSDDLEDKQRLDGSKDTRRSAEGESRESGDNTENHKSQEGNSRLADGTRSHSKQESPEGQGTSEGMEETAGKGNAAAGKSEKAAASDTEPLRAVLRIGREDFMRIIRVYCKVVKEIILSDNLAIENSEQIRQLDVGEVVEVYQGPVVEPSVSVLRVHGRALRDGAVGWATISGSQGVTFLVPGGNVMRVLQPAALADELKDTAGAKTIRTLAEGEVLEVLDWARTSRSALGVTRVRAKVRGDGVVGWATTADGSGQRFLEAL